MKTKSTWTVGLFGIAFSTSLVVKEHFDLAHGSGVPDWLILAFKYFNYPGFLAAPWIVDHLPFIAHGDIRTIVTEVNLTEGFYIAISGLTWFAIGAVLSVLSRKLREQ